MSNITIYTILSVLVTISAHKLEQVLILSRHNIRAPLSANLEKFSQKPWPKWTEKATFLTEKGARMEENMGEYIAEWLRDEKLLPQGCPDDSVHIYANTRQRTRESAKAFAKGAFKCNVTVYSIKSDKMDPVFNPILRNDSTLLKEAIMNEMQQQINELQLTEAYELLEDILDLKNSSVCKDEGICSFLVKDQIFYEIGEEPNVIGPLAQGNSIVDSFLMSYYEGMPLEDVAWGKSSDENWKLLTKITKENQNVRFNSTILAREVAKPLLEYMLNIFESKTPKFTLLHGHDANLNSVMASIGFKSYILPNQYETTPLGGKLVFQKRSHGPKNLFKAHFVYQTTEQLREGSELSKKNPPKWVELEVVGCPKDKDGFCLWDDFMEVMRSL